MRPELKEIQLLEGYVQGSLNEAQRVDAEVRLLWDRDWQANLVAQQKAYAAIRETGRQRLRQEMRAIHVRLFS
jgi:hypothetical protein